MNGTSSLNRYHFFPLAESHLVEKVITHCKHLDCIRSLPHHIFQRSAKLLLPAPSDLSLFSSGSGSYQTFTEHWLLI